MTSNDTLGYQGLEMAGDWVRAHNWAEAEAGPSQGPMTHC